MTTMSVDNNTLGLVPQRQKASDDDKCGPVPQLQNVSPSVDTTDPSQQELDLLFDPLYDEFFTAHGFIDPDHPKKVYHLRKALYGLKQAPRAWYDELSNLLMSKGLTKGTIDPTLFMIKYGEDILLVQIYDCTAMSLAKEEHMALSASCAQVMRIRTQLKDYGFNYNKIPLYCDSQSAIAISCNPVQHSRTKHIHTRYHFIKEQVKNDIIELYFVITEYQLAVMFTKALPEDRFQYLVRQIGMRCMTLAELEVLANESA
nr:retrovirus-related Pol polyprotein from transposon TNT 1-94 [Tanacetum cinerariifolium]